MLNFPNLSNLITHSNSHCLNHAKLPLTTLSFFSSSCRFLGTWHITSGLGQKVDGRVFVGVGVRTDGGVFSMRLPFFCCCLQPFAIEIWRYCMIKCLAWCHTPYVKVKGLFPKLWLKQLEIVTETKLLKTVCVTFQWLPQNVGNYLLCLSYFTGYSMQYEKMVGIKTLQVNMFVLTEWKHTCSPRLQCKWLTGVLQRQSSWQTGLDRWLLPAKKGFSPPPKFDPGHTATTKHSMMTQIHYILTTFKKNILLNRKTDHNLRLIYRLFFCTLKFTWMINKLKP